MTDFRTKEGLLLSVSKSCLCSSSSRHCGEKNEHAHHREDVVFLFSDSPLIHGLLLRRSCSVTVGMQVQTQTQTQPGVSGNNAIDASSRQP